MTESVTAKKIVHIHTYPHVHREALSLTSKNWAEIGHINPRKNTTKALHDPHSICV